MGALDCLPLILSQEPVETRSLALNPVCSPASVLIRSTLGFCVHRLCLPNTPASACTARPVYPQDVYGSVTSWAILTESLWLLLVSVSPKGPQTKEVRCSMVPLCHSSRSWGGNHLSVCISHPKLRSPEQRAPKPAYLLLCAQRPGCESEYVTAQDIFGHGGAHSFSPKQWISLLLVWNFGTTRQSESVLPSLSFSGISVRGPLSLADAPSA